MVTEDYTPEEQDRAQQQEDRIKEIAWVDPDHNEGEIIGDNYENSPRYTKDLEDMLGRFIGLIKHDKKNNECWIGFGWTARWLAPHCPICEAKALLERTGYTMNLIIRR